MATKWKKIVDENGNILYLNALTGEVFSEQELEDVYIETSSQREARKEYFKKKQETEIENYFMKEEYSEYGNFFWYLYRKNKLELECLTPIHTFRLMYLVTYMTYDGYLKVNKRRYCSKNDLQKILKLKDTEFKNFYNAVIKNNILIVEENENGIRYKINPDIFSKGELNNELCEKLNNKDLSIIRIYQDITRKLYETAKHNSYKRLGYLFQLIPYINKEYNLICINPEETDLEKVRPMELSDVCKLIGYSARNQSILLKELLKITFTDKGTKYSVFTYVMSTVDDKPVVKMFINPSLYYAGSCKERVELMSSVKFNKKLKG